MQQPAHEERSPWTFSQLRPEPTTSGRRIKDAVKGDLVSILRFYGTTRTAIIDQDELRALEPKQWLSGELCTFWCYEVGNAYLEGGPGRSRDLVVLHCVTWSYGSWPPDVVKKLRVPGALHTLEHKYIALPGNDTNTHFFLCIIVDASDLLLDINPSGPVRTTAIILNSIKNMPPTDPEQKVKAIIAQLAEGRKLRTTELDTITVHQPLVRNLWRRPSLLIYDALNLTFHTSIGGTTTERLRLWAVSWALPFGVPNVPGDL